MSSSQSARKPVTNGGLLCWFIGISVVGFSSGVFAAVTVGWNPNIVWSIVSCVLITARLATWVHRGQIK